MIHSHQENMRRIKTFVPSSHTLRNDTYGSHESFNYSKHDNSFQNTEFTEPKYNNVYFNDKKERTRYDKHSKFFNSKSFDVTEYSTGGTLREPCQKGWGQLTPPATDSSSRSTIFSCNSAPPLYTDFNHCPSPVLSEDFERPYTSLGSYNSSEFHRKDSACEEYFELMKGCCTKEGGGVIYGQENIYTAETVHNLVKNRRDGNKRRIVSNKVFVGGISHSMNRETINSFFARFGTVFIDWPVKGPRTNARGKPMAVSSYSYLFLVYFDERSVIKLMEACHNPSYNEYYVSVPGCRESLIQIRPWFISNAFYINEKSIDRRCIDIHRTVFVGGLPRIVTAEEIAQMFSKFGTVLLVTIDIDQDYGYPKGAARVAFERDEAFTTALRKKYLKFNDIDSSKTLIEIKPYIMEDVGCDQCGGLWFNPFLEVLDQLKGGSDREEKAIGHRFCLPHASSELRSFNMWSCDHPFSASNALKDSMNSSLNADQDNNDVRAGSKKFIEATKRFHLDQCHYVIVEKVKYNLGPDLWNQFVAPPYYEVSHEPVQIRVDHQIETYLRLKRGNVYSNKSSYCKEEPCRQYYCPSCSNKLHSGPNQHILLPAGKPERRPRKDKNMYLVPQQ